MSTKDKKIMSYSPSDSDFKHMMHCHKLGLIKLGIGRVNNFTDEYHIIKFDDSKTPAVMTYFLKDFTLPPTPSNKAVFTEYNAYKKIFEIYKEFYMRNHNISEAVIREEYVKSKEEEIKKESPKKKTKEEKYNEETKSLLDYPNKQIDLFEMIDEIEKRK